MKEKHLHPGEGTDDTQSPSTDLLITSRASRKKPPPQTLEYLHAEAKLKLRRSSLYLSSIASF